MAWRGLDKVFLLCAVESLRPRAIAASHAKQLITYTVAHAGKLHLQRSGRGDTCPLCSEGVYSGRAMDATMCLLPVAALNRPL